VSQINFLHRKIGGTEWSGILLYSHREGDIKDADNLTLVAEEIFLMDIGSPGYTEYINDVDSILELVDSYPKYESGDLKIGHIHTHHNMSTGFSSTDISELQDNAPSHNYYLSLIVNFKCKPTAKIATVCEVQPGNITHPGANDNVEKEMEAEKRLGVYDLIITQERDQRFLDRYSLIRKQKKEEEKKKKKNRKVNRYNGKKGYPGIPQNVKNWQGGSGKHSNGFNNGYSQRDMFEPDFSEAQIDDFIYKWFNLNPHLPVVGDTEGAIDQMDLFMKDAPKDQVESLVDQLTENYEDFAMKVIGQEWGLTDDEYLKLTEIVIQKLEPYEDNRIVSRILNDLQIYEETLTEMVEEDARS